MKNNNSSHFHTLKKLFSYLWIKDRWDLKARVVIALFFLLLAKLINTYVPFLYKACVDYLSEDIELVHVPILLIVSYGLARVMHQLFSELRDFVFVKVTQNAQRSIALDTFKHLHKLSLSFHLNRQTGGLSRVIERGTQGIQFVLSFLIFNILPTIMEIALVTIILLLKFKWSFALITFVTIVIYIAFTLLATEWRLKFRKEMNEKDTEANSKAIDSLINYETVKYFNNEKHEYQRFDVSLAAYEKAAISSQSSLSILNIGQGIIIGIGLIWVMLLAGQGIVDKSMTLGDFVLVNTFLIQLYMPLNFLGFVYRQIKNGLVNMDKMFELLQVNAEIKDVPDAQYMQKITGDIAFENVEFSYNSDRTILNDVSFSINQGETLAVVGSSGAGKSTISRLLYRFYDIQSGQICIDGVNIQSLKQNCLRKNIGIVPQDTVLFNDTIYYNIAYGDLSKSENDIKAAAHAAELDTFIERLPDGYQTKVGERGLKLSGGEKQRVAIARAILKNPPILIFDEATSALDTKTESEIQKALEKLAKNRTTIVIAHRLSTVVNADKIIVLDQGQIKEQGTHTSLLKQKGMYAKMWQMQQ